MIIIMKPQASKEDVQKVTFLIESKGLQAVSYTHLDHVR